MSEHKKIEMFLFDLDFTLIDASNVMYEGVKQALIDLQLEPVPTYEKIKELTNFSLPEHEIPSLCHKITGGSTDEQFIEQFKKVYYNVVHTRIIDGTVLLPGAIPLLEYLREKQMKLGIVTAKSRQLAVRTLEKFGILSKFDVLICKEDVSKPKPHPEGILMAMRILKIRSVDEVLFVGDDIRDAEAAESAGSRFLGVPYVSSNDVFKKNGFEIVTSLNDLLVRLRQLITVQDLIANYRILYTSLPKNQFIDTEDVCPTTVNLSRLAQTDLPEAYDKLVQVDVALLEKISQKSDTVKSLQQAFVQALHSNGRIFLFGSGSSGRLLVLLKKILMNDFAEHQDKFVSVIFGGDIALAQIAPNLEEFPEHGLRQLTEAGWRKAKDLLVGVSVSGTASFILEMIKYVAKVSMLNPVYIFYNPINELVHCDRFRDFYGKLRSKVQLIDLSTGPMAVTGSLGMQAATVTMIVVGIAMMNSISQAEMGAPQLHLETYMVELIGLVKQLAKLNDINLIRAEAECYRAKKKVLYVVDSETALPVLIDTVERIVAFNLSPFVNKYDSNMPTIQPSSFLVLRNATNALGAWFNILGRQPTVLNWKEIAATNHIKLHGFDFSRSNVDFKPEFDFVIKLDSQTYVVALEFQHLKRYIHMPPQPLTRHILLKLLLNNRSTLMMGILGYYDGNVMIHLAPNNTKLIHRGIYYTYKMMANFDYEHYSLPKHMQHRFSRDDVERCFFSQMQYLAPGQSILLNVRKILLDQYIFELLDCFLIREQLCMALLKTREGIIDSWLKTVCSTSEIPLGYRIERFVRGAGDRQYLRIILNNHLSFVLMYSPSITEIMQFLSVGKLFEHMIVPTPKVHMIDVEWKLVLLEDLGDVTLLDYVSQASTSMIARLSAYLQAVELILLLQNKFAREKSFLDKKYSQMKLVDEMHLFETYFIQGYLGISLTSKQKQVLNRVITDVARYITSQPKTLVHKDFQSTNLMVVKKQLFVLDFQAALYGHYTYDLVCLTRDCYYILPINERQQLEQHYYQQTRFRKISKADFLQDISNSVLHRHIKSPGTFAYLFLERNRPEYLQFIRNSLWYIFEVAECRDDLHEFGQLIQLLDKKTEEQQRKDRVMISMKRTELYLPIVQNTSKLIVVTGTASSGKSSMIASYLSICTGKIICVSIDAIKHMYLYEHFSKLASEKFQPFAQRYGLHAAYYINNVDNQQNPFVMYWINSLSESERSSLIFQAVELKKKFTIQKGVTYDLYVRNEASRQILYGLEHGFVVVVDVTNIQDCPIEIENRLVITVFCDLLELLQRIDVRNHAALKEHVPIEYRHPLVAFDQYFSRYSIYAGEMITKFQSNVLDVMSTDALIDTLDNIYNVDPYFASHSSGKTDCQTRKQAFLQKVANFNTHNTKSVYVTTKLSSTHRRNTFTLFSKKLLVADLALSFKFIVENKIKSAIILSAGQGTRMITHGVHKSLSKIGGLSLIEHHLIKLRRIGIRTAVITVFYLKEQIMNHLGNGEKYGIRIIYAIEPQCLNTGAGLLNAISLLDDQTTHFYLLSADIWHDADLSLVDVSKINLCHLFLRYSDAMNSGKYDLRNNLLISGNKYYFSGIGVFRRIFFETYKPCKPVFPLREIIFWGVDKQLVTAEVFSGTYVNINTSDDIRTAEVFYANSDYASRYCEYLAQ